MLSVCLSRDELAEVAAVEDEALRNLELGVRQIVPFFSLTRSCPAQQDGGEESEEEATGDMMLGGGGGGGGAQRVPSGGNPRSNS